MKLTEIRIQSKTPIVVNRGNPADDDITYKTQDIDIRGEIEFNSASDLKSFLDMLQNNS